MSDANSADALSSFPLSLSPPNARLYDELLGFRMSRSAVLSREGLVQLKDLGGSSGARRNEVVDRWFLPAIDLVRTRLRHGWDRIGATRSNEVERMAA